MSDMHHESPQPPHPYTVLQELAAMRADFRVLCEKVASIASIVERQGELERALADQAFWRNTVNDERRTMWKRIDDMQSWTTEHDNEASDRNQKIMDMLDLKLTNLRNEVNAQTAKVEEIATNAAQEAAATTNKSRGVGIALGICAAIFGTLLTASILWLFSTTQHSSERISVLEAQQHNIGGQRDFPK